MALEPVCVWRFLNLRVDWAHVDLHLPVLVEVLAEKAWAVARLVVLVEEQELMELELVLVA